MFSLLDDCVLGVIEMPLLDFHLRDMFHLLGVDNVLNLFSSILLERQVLLYSQGKPSQQHQIVKTRADPAFVKHLMNKMHKHTFYKIM